MLCVSKAWPKPQQPTRAPRHALPRALERDRAGSGTSPNVITDATATAQHRSGRHRRHAAVLEKTPSSIGSATRSAEGFETASAAEERGRYRARIHNRPANRRPWFRKLAALALIAYIGTISGVVLGSAANVATSLRLEVSTHSDRGSAVPLNGATLSGSAYIFVDADGAAVKRVMLTLDPGTAKARQVIDRHAPFDFGGTLPDGSAKPLDVSTLGVGNHEMRAAVRFATGRTRSISAAFTVLPALPNTTTGMPTLSMTTPPSSIAPTPSTASSPSATSVPTAPPSTPTTSPTPPGTTTSLPAASLAASGPLVIDGKNGTVIEGVRIRSDSGECIVIRSSQNITIRNSDIGPCNKNAIKIQGSGAVTIVDNYIHTERRPAGCCDTNDGIFASGAGGVLIQGNVIAFNETNIELQSASDVKVIGNYLLNPLGPFPRGQQVQSWNNSSNITVEDNYMVSSTDTGTHPFPADQEDAINFGFTDGITARGNFVVGGDSPTGCGLITDQAANNARFLSNTLVRTGQCGIGIASGTNVVADSNRIFNNSAVPGGGNTALYVWSQYSQACGPVQVTNNIIYGVKPDGTPSSYWNGGGCGSVTYTGNTVSQQAYSQLSPDSQKLPRPAIPPKPHSCVAPAPYVTQTGWQSCVRAG